LLDFDCRAIHEAKDKAKSIIQASYGDRTRRAYLSEVALTK
jgi:regulator of extracellular matrix RemA (YlzA/DUF370 family)